MAFNLYFRGELAPDVTRQQAAERLSKLVKQPPDLVEQRLFTGMDVKVTSAKKRKQAESLKRAFEKAGVIIDIVETSKLSRRKGASSRGGAGAMRWVAVAAVVIVAIGGAAAWYTQPIWGGGSTSAIQRTASYALADEDMVALLHLDVDRAVALQSRIMGAPDPDAMIAPGAEDVFSNLARAGIGFRKQVDDILMALYSDAGETYWAVVMLGSVPVSAVHAVIDQQFDIERRDGDTIYFTWLDQATCLPSELHAINVTDSHMVISSADRLAAINTKIDSSANAGVAGMDDWMARVDDQLLTLGVFLPESVGDFADGLAGMMLASAGEAASPAETLLLGVAPTLAPPGAVVRASVVSDDPAFLDMAHTAASGWLAMSKMGAQADSPELLPLYDRITVAREGRAFEAGVQLDTDIGAEFEMLGGALFGGMFGGGSSSMMGSTGPIEDQVEESPLQFANATPADLQPFSAFGDAFFKPQWQQGPFAMLVSRINVSDAGDLTVELKTEGRGLPNLGERSQLVRLQVTDVVADDGRSLLPPNECGPVRNTAWTDSAMVSQGTRFVNNEVAYYPTASIVKELNLGDASAADVAAIRGNIEFQLPAEVRSVRVDSLADGIVESSDVRVKFKEGSPSSLSFEISGDARRVLDVRALNASGQVLESGSSMSSSTMFGGGKSVTIDYYGTVAAAEVVLGERLEPVLYGFELPGALPNIDSDFARDIPPVAIATPDALASVLDVPAPDVTFDYFEPEALTSAGPALLSLQQMQAGSFMGFYAQFELYVPSDVPIANQISGATIALDSAVLEDGSAIDLAASMPVSLSPDGGYWMNGEFQPDEDRPWSKGSATIQLADYEGETPIELVGRVLFRAVTDTRDDEFPAEPGGRLTADGIDLMVREWRDNSLSVDILDGADRLVSLTALDEDGQIVGGGTDVGGMGDDQHVSVDLHGRPASLVVKYAAHSTAIERPFTLTLDN